MYDRNGTLDVGHIPASLPPVIGGGRILLRRRTTPSPSRLDCPDETDDNNNNNNDDDDEFRTHSRMSFQITVMNLANEVWLSSELLLSNKLSWLLILGPIALVGDYTGFLGEAMCFALSGIALIPCAERYVHPN